MTEITDRGPHARDRTLDIDEIQFLMGTEADLRFHYWGYIGLLRVRGSLWIVADADGDVQQKDLADEEILPLQRNEEYPLENRPMYVLPMTTTNEDLNRMRMQARMLADILGAEAPASSSAASSQWYFADPAFSEFGAAVPHDKVGRPEYFVVRGASALVRVDEVGEEEDWTYAERVSEEDRTGWVVEKREGAGRDKRLLALPVTSAGTTPLFREVNASSDHGAGLERFGDIFEGTLATGEVMDGITASGMEPMTYCAQFFSHTGVSPKASGAIELSNHFFTLWLMGCVDRTDPRHSAAAEHVCRRILQQQVAMRRDPRSHNYENLEPYMAHTSDMTGVLKATKFEKHVADRNRDRANVMKQMRLAREETEQREDKTDKKGKGQKNKKKEDEG